MTKWDIEPAIRAAKAEGFVEGLEAAAAFCKSTAEYALESASENLTERHLAYSSALSVASDRVLLTPNPYATNSVNLGHVETADGAPITE